jgi:hypothetical protein
MTDYFIEPQNHLAPSCHGEPVESMAGTTKEYQNIVLYKQRNRSTYGSISICRGFQTSCDIKQEITGENMKGFLRYVLFFCIIGMLTVFAGCGGGGGGSSKTTGGGGGSTPTAPTNVTTTTKTPTEIIIGWQDNSSNEERFRIYRCDGAGCNPTALLQSINPNIITHTDSGLLSGTTYCYKVCAYNSYGQNCSGNSCSTTTTIFDQGFGDAENPRIAMDLNGNVMAVWTQLKESVFLYIIYARRYNATTKTWGGVSILMDTTLGDDGINPHVAGNQSGNSFAVWQQGGVIKSRRYIASSNSWDINIVTIDDGTGGSDFPQVAMDTAGNAIVVWQQDFKIFSRRFTASLGTWDTAQQLDNGTGIADYPKIAMDSSGNALVSWKQENTDLDVYRNQYTAGVGWSGPVFVAAGSDDIDITESAQIAIAMNPTGNAMLIYKGKDLKLYAIRYLKNTGWGTATAIVSSLGEVFNPHAATNNSGNVIVVWEQDFQIYGNYFTASNQTWKTASIIDTGAGEVFNPQAGIDTNGDGITVWSQLDGSYFKIYSSKYDVISGWSTAVPIQSGEGDAEKPQLAMNSDSYAFTVWQQLDSANYISLYSYRFE